MYEMTNFPASYLKADSEAKHKYCLSIGPFMHKDTKSLRTNYVGPYVALTKQGTA